MTMFDGYGDCGYGELMDMEMEMDFVPVITHWPPRQGSSSRLAPLRVVSGWARAHGWPGDPPRVALLPNPPPPLPCVLQSTPAAVPPDPQPEPAAVLLRPPTVEDLQRERRRLEVRLEALSRNYLDTTARLREAEKYAEETHEKHAKYVEAVAKRESNFLKDSMATEKALQTKIRAQEDKVTAAVTKLDIMEDKLTCVICMDSERDTVPPCGHLSMCSNCAHANNPKKCPVCRKVYRMQTLRKIFYS